MTYLALSPVSDAVYAALNVDALTTLATGGLSDDIAQAKKFPYVFFVVSESERRGLGTGGLPLIDLRVHVYGTPEQGLKALQAIVQKVIELLKDQALSLTGYRQCGKVFYDQTLTFGDELVNNQKVHEIVASFRIFVEET